jgi:hypothetical protein
LRVSGFGPGVAFGGAATCLCFFMP